MASIERSGITPIVGLAAALIVAAVALWTPTCAAQSGVCIGQLETCSPPPRPNTYVTMPDGTSIALNIQFPAGSMPTGGWPAIIDINGYEGASAPPDPVGAPYYAGGNYVVVRMSLRGTGCSGGQFDLFDQRSAQDGFNVIEWLARQSWSNHKVAIWGHSYSGLEGWLVAATQPPHLVAATLSGLIDDLYKGITYMGGVSNFGFPLIWTGVFRPLRDVGQGAAEAIAVGDTTCAANQASHVPPSVVGDPTDNPIINGLASLGEENQWWVTHSLVTYLNGINVPVEMVQTYQDEQTGPRGTNLLFQRLEEQKPPLAVRLLLTNGYHDTTWQPPELHQDRIAWLDCYVRGICAPGINDSSQRVRVFWEMHADSTGTLVSNGLTTDPRWPLSVTQWVPYYFGSGGVLTTTTPDSSESADLYVSGSKRAGAWTEYPALLGVTDQHTSNNLGAQVTTANLPDEVRYSTAPFQSTTAIAGPIDVTLYASSTAPDTEFYVELNDIDQSGEVTRLQRGMLKASHRAVDPLLSDYSGCAGLAGGCKGGAVGNLIRPYHPDTNTLTAVITPGQVYQYDVEVFPVGFVFRSGHRLLLRVTTPPAADSLAAYIPATVPGVNQLFHDSQHPSSVRLPIIPLDGTTLGTELPCGAQVGLERCSKPIN